MNNKENKELSPETKARRQYYKIWRQKNKDKVKQYNSNFWLKKADKKPNNK